MELTETKFKQTEVGLIPEDWKVGKLEDFYNYISYGFTNPMPESSIGIFLITAKDINHGKLQLRTARKTTKWAYNNLLTSKSKPIKNDLLLTKDGTLGRLAVVGDEKICITQSVAIIRVKPKLVDVFFLQKLLESEYYQKVMLENAGGSTIKHIYISIVNKMILGLPSAIEEQKAIASALSDVDDLINNLEKLIEKKKGIKQGTLQRLLTAPDYGGLRLKGFKGKWVEKTIGEIASITGAGVDKKIKPDEVPVTLLNYLDVYRRDYIFGNELNHQVTAPAYKVVNCNVKKGDIFLTPSSELRTDIGISALAMEDMPNIVYSYHIYRLRFHEPIDTLFSLYVLKTKDFLSKAETLCEGSGKRYVISMSKFASIKISLPVDVNEQEAIGKIIYSQDKEIERLYQKLRKLVNLKHGMMQELLTGKTRLI